jgi:hypothetical protein
VPIPEGQSATLCGEYFKNGRCGGWEKSRDWRREWDNTEIKLTEKPVHKPLGFPTDAAKFSISENIQDFFRKRN